VQTALDRCGDDQTLLYIVGLPDLMKEPKPADPNAPQPPKRKCGYQSYVTTQLRMMLTSAPMNETFRAMLMAKVGEMPPKEVDTWPKIVDWIEFNFPRNGTTPVLASNRIILHTRVNRIDVGTCKYERRMSGSGVVELKADDIIAAANESDNNEDFWSLITQKFEEAADSLNLSVQEETTSRHEVEDRRSEQFTYNHPSLVAQVKAVIPNVLDQDQIDNLEL
jgi:hypothetical protein